MNREIPVKRKEKKRSHAGSGRLSRNVNIFRPEWEKQQSPSVRGTSANFLRHSLSQSADRESKDNAKDMKQTNMIAWGGLEKGEVHVSRRKNSQPRVFLPFNVAVQARRVFLRDCEEHWKDVGRPEIPARLPKTQLCCGTFSQRPVRVHVVHVPSGVLPLGPGPPEHLRRCVCVRPVRFRSLLFCNESGG